MNLYKTTILPESNFATTLRGDTLFGQMCWSIKYAFGEERLKELLETYEKKPFLVVSDGFVSGYLPKPKMPSILLGEDSEDKKVNRKKIWLTLEQLQSGKFSDAKTDKKVENDDKDIMTMHNSINYKSFTTSDDGSFAPYGEKEFSLGKKDIYFLIDDSQFSLDELKKTFEQLSLGGYGKDTTVGKGRFTFGDLEEIKIDNSSKTFMSISPFSPQGIECKEIYYEPFTRFGKFGGDRAFKNAFKKPILMADCASVVHFEEIQKLQYIGNAIKNVSDAHPDTVHQGYSIVVPIKELL
jgi:CRISPR-associated protein Csm4